MFNVACSEMKVQWTTRDPGTPTVKYGTKSGQYTKTATGKTVTYYAETLCGSPGNSTGWVPPGSLHRVNLTALTTSTRYYYVFGDPVRAHPACIEGKPCSISICSARLSNITYRKQIYMMFMLRTLQVSHHSASLCRLACVKRKWITVVASV